jgi:arylsulfatase A-like enzyme
LRNGKGSPYEEDIRVPFIVRGPGVQAGTALEGYLAGNVDIAPTIAELAGVIPPAYVDGRSLAGLWTGALPDQWRDGYLLEFYGYNAEGQDTAPLPTPEFLGLRTQQYLYAEYNDGFMELYDLQADPDQMDNIASSADPGLLAHLSAWLHALAQCKAETCRELDREPAR